jgi:EAL domain-containing protein (putative c-di-GMP-specific phosphodiesterase class I)
MSTSVSASSAPSYPSSLAELGPIQVQLQPIVNVATGVIVGAEALARFPRLHRWNVEEVFALARLGGWGAELEAACLREAIAAREQIPAAVCLTVNASPDALSHPLVRPFLDRDLSGIVVEITENQARDSGALDRALTVIRGRGAQIAIDDASSGYAGLLRLSGLRPDLVKLDRALVTQARGNDVQIVVIEALVSFCRRIGARVLGEGVESLDDLRLLGELDVDYAQGWAVARPETKLPHRLIEVEDACRSARRALMRAPATDTEPSQPATHAVTAALADSTQPDDVRAALNAAAIDLGVDVIGLSTLSNDGYLHEITASGADLDPHRYALADFPATRDALAGATVTEAHLNDPYTDTAERSLLARDGFASVLVTPVIRHDERLGILEFSTREHHQWTRRDVVRARTIADHLASALLRIRDANVAY